MSRRILLADDSVTIQKVIELTFMDDDYEVRAVGNGDEALAMLTALTVDFVIADVHMPGASGYEVCRRSKQLRPEVPVLLLVGTFEPFDEAQARESGADSYLKKPFDSQELLGRVHELLGPAAAAAATAAGAPQPESATAPPAAPATSAAPVTPAPSAPSAMASASTVPEPAAAAPAGETPAAAGAGTGQGVRLTGGVEAAASWQEFELEAEPELVADPWPDVPPSPPADAKVPPAARPYEQPFALGDLDELATSAEPAKPAASGAAASPADEARPSTPDWLPAAPAAPAVAAAERFDRPFTLGEPLDDRVLLDQAEAQEEEEKKKEREVVPAASESADERALRATQEEPMSMFGAAPRSSGPGGDAAATPETAAKTAETERSQRAEQPEQRAAAAAAGNGQPASQLTANAADAADAGTAALGDQDVDRIARRVVELIGDKVVRDIAWEVIPDLAEVVIKDRLRELESQIE
jgi:CheY-like chemotaxis protein